MLGAFFDSYNSVILNNSIPRVRVGYELAIIMSYPISASGIIVLHAWSPFSRGEGGDVWGRASPESFEISKP